MDLIQSLGASRATSRITRHYPHNQSPMKRSLDLGLDET
jgi:hypothetical protein